jgi:hypothetical protein
VRLAPGFPWPERRAALAADSNAPNGGPSHRKAPSPRIACAIHGLSTCTMSPSRSSCQAATYAPPGRSTHVHRMVTSSDTSEEVAPELQSGLQTRAHPAPSAGSRSTPSALHWRSLHSSRLGPASRGSGFSPRVLSRPLLRARGSRAEYSTSAPPDPSPPFNGIRARPLPVQEGVNRSARTVGYACKSTGDAEFWHQPAASISPCCTANLTGPWVTQQARQFIWALQAQPPRFRFSIRNRDAIVRVRL